MEPQIFVTSLFQLPTAPDDCDRLDLSMGKVWSFHHTPLAKSEGRQQCTIYRIFVLIIDTKKGQYRLVRFSV